jgi:glycerophosphoryl diester phosphodiesterase
MPRDIDYDGWIDTITKEIDHGLREASWPENLARPCACAITYSSHRREIWRVGDSSFRINGNDYRGGKVIDDIICEARASVLLEAIRLGYTVEELLENDFGRDAIMPIAREQYRLANNLEHPLGYPVFDGNFIPKELREPIISVPHGAHVVIYSDGFDFPGDTLSEMLESQQTSYAADPLRIGRDGSSPSTKGVLHGQRHDDQTFVSFFAD